MFSSAMWSPLHPPTSSDESASSRSATLLLTRRRYGLVWHWQSTKPFCSERWLILRPDGISGHIRQCCGDGCALRTRERHLCSVLQHWTQRVLSGSKSAWALRERRWRFCQAAVIGQTFTSRVGVSTGDWMFGEHLKLISQQTSLFTWSSQEHRQGPGLCSTSPGR